MKKPEKWATENVILGVTVVILIILTVIPISFAIRIEKEFGKTPQEIIARIVEDQASRDWLYLTIFAILFGVLCVFSISAFFAISTAQLIVREGERRDKDIIDLKQQLDAQDQKLDKILDSIAISEYFSDSKRAKQLMQMAEDVATMCRMVEQLVEDRDIFDIDESDSSAIDDD